MNKIIHTKKYIADTRPFVGHTGGRSKPETV